MSHRRHPSREPRRGSIEVDAQGRRWVKVRTLGDIYADVMRDLDADLRISAIVHGAPTLSDSAARRLGYEPETTP